MQVLLCGEGLESDAQRPIRWNRLLGLAEEGLFDSIDRHFKGDKQHLASFGTAS